MKKKSSAFRNFLRATRGANMVEYIILVGLVALLCVGGYGIFGKQVDKSIKEQSNSVGVVNTKAVGAP